MGRGKAWGWGGGGSKWSTGDDKTPLIIEKMNNTGNNWETLDYTEVKSNFLSLCGL